MVDPCLSSSSIPLSDMLPTGTSPLRTGSWEYPVALMRSDAWWTLSVLWTVTTFSEATSAAVRSFFSSLLIPSRVSKSLTTVS